MKSIDTRFFRNVFEAVQKNSQHVSLSGQKVYLVKNHSAAPHGFKPNKERCKVSKHLQADDV